MLYVTTRNQQNTFTPWQVLQVNRSVDGGFFLPFREPCFSSEEIQALESKPFGQCVADILNNLFQTELTGWDVDFSIGRYPARFTTLSNRIFVGEVWHNPDWKFDFLIDNLAKLIGVKQDVPGDWVRIGIRISVMFGLFGQLFRQGISSADISFVAGDFTVPISAWYARKWGLPIRNIICTCNENKGLWDLLCQGQMRTDFVSVPTSLPEADVSVPTALEHLIYGCGGVSEVEHYLDCIRTGVMYIPGAGMLSQITNGLYVSVVSSKRIPETIAGVYSSHEYLMTSPTAMAYAGMLDYRVKQAENRHVIVWSEKAPICEANTIAKSLSIPVELLLKMI